jgi:GNAT superfamily N-acetyltransferase
VSETAPLIGLATPADVPELARLRWSLYAEQNGEPAEPFESYVARFASFASAALSSSDWRIWVAREGSRLVGAMWLRTFARVPVPGRRAGPIGYLTNVYVEPDRRDAGLGSAMLRNVTTWCRAEGCSDVIVWPTARSRTFYGRAGFDRADEPLVLDLGPDPPPG